MSESVFNEITRRAKVILQRHGTVMLDSQDYSKAFVGSYMITSRLNDVYVHFLRGGSTNVGGRTSEVVFSSVTDRNANDVPYDGWALILKAFRTYTLLDDLADV